MNEQTESPSGDFWKFVKQMKVSKINEFGPESNVGPEEGVRATKLIFDWANGTGEWVEGVKLKTHVEIKPDPRTGVLYWICKGTLSNGTKTKFKEKLIPATN